MSGSQSPRLYTGIVQDVLRSRGITGQVLPSDLRPVIPNVVLEGEVFTVTGHPEPDIDPHESLLAWTEFLSAVPPDVVVVCQPNDGELAHMGELSAETLHHRGVRGYVVDGGTRDSAFLTRLGFPVWCRYRTPVDIVGRWRATALGEPIILGRTTVTLGDRLVADDDGVVVVPGHLGQDVLDEARELAGREDLVRAAILDGVPPRDAYLAHGKF